MNETAENRAQSHARKRRRWPWVVGGIVILLLLLLALLPVVVSSQRVTQMIQARISRSTGGTAAIGDLAVGWWKGVRVSDFRFEDQAGWTTVNIARIAARPQLARLLGGDLALGRTVVDEPRVELDLRRRPAPKPGTGTESSGSSSQVRALALAGDLVVNNGSVRVTDATGKTVELGQLNTELRVRPPGQSSRLQLDMVVDDGGQPGQVRAAAQVTPQVDRGGWQMKGTSGELTVEVNDLNLESLGSFLALAGVDVRGQGKVTGTLKSSMVDGQLEDVNAVLTGSDIEIAGQQLKGDRLQTSTLDVDARLGREGQTYRIRNLKAKTDWASVTATGVLPTTAGSLQDVLTSDAAYDLQAQFDFDLATMLSQMPKTLGLKPGTQITSGQATGNVETRKEGDRLKIVARTNVTNLAGTVEGKTIELSEPLVASAALSADGETMRLDQLDVSAAFAKITANGDFEQIDYDGTFDLAKLEAELGQFVDLGPYQMAGEMSSQGQVSIGEKQTSFTGSASAQQFVLASAKGPRVTEPSIDVDFGLTTDREKQLLNVTKLSVRGGFGRIDVSEGVVPLDESSPAVMALDVRAAGLDLQKAGPYGIVLGVLPEKLELSGIAEARFAVTEEDKTYHARTEGARIEDFRLRVAPEEPFEQKQVTAFLDARLAPKENAMNVQVRIEGPNITIAANYAKKLEGEQTKIQGDLEGQGDPNAVGPLASVFAPAELELTGRSTVDLDFASTYPSNEPNELLTNLDSTGRVTFDRAEYLGLNFGLIDANLIVAGGVMEIPPFEATVNEGTLQFAARADLRDEPRLLRTPGSAFVARNIQLNTETTEKMLKYVNPLFANLIGVSGRADFECETLIIPLTGGHKDKLQVVGTISATDLQLGAGGLLAQLLTAMGEPMRRQRLTIRPTRIVVQDGMVRYDNMQVDVGDNPLNFGGAIGLDGRLNMTVTLPWTLRGRTARVGEGDRAGQRIPLPLGGTVDNPQLDTQKLLQEEVIKGLLRELFK